MQEGHFFAMLGFGPIGAGYSIIATIEHEPSMFDVAAPVAAELDEFSASVRSRLEADFGSAVLTEHGRVAPCVAIPTRAHEAHCLHAHRLVFCDQDHVDVRSLAPAYHWKRFASLDEARRADPGGQYLCCEQADGTVDLAPVVGPLRRQFFRSLLAEVAGQPELADWRSHQGDEAIRAGRRVLLGS